MDNDKEAKVSMTKLQRHNLFEFGEVPKEKSNEGWSDDEYTKQKTAFNPWCCIPSIPDCPEPILEPGPFHSLGPNDKLIVNQTYNTKKELAFAVKLKAVREKFQIKVEKSSKSWYRTFNDEHTCSSLLIHPNHRQANSEVVGTIIHDIMGQGSMNALLQINMSYSQAWHAREFALGLMMGTPEESFSKLPVYFHSLKKHNPGTVAYIKTDSEDHFEYCFFTIGCAIRAFRECCKKRKIQRRHLACSDHGWQQLDLAYWTTDSWTWFLEKLHECIGDVEGLTMVIDRASTIAVSIQNVFPNAQHGLCAFHLIGNIVHTLGKNKKNNNFLVSAYKTTEFELYWGRLHNIRDDVATYLSQIPHEKWTKAYCPTTRYDYMTSNSAESMNVYEIKQGSCLYYHFLSSFTHLCRNDKNVQQYLRSGLEIWLKKIKMGFKDGRYPVLTIQHIKCITSKVAVYSLSELSDWEVSDDLMVVNPPVMEIRQAGRPKNTNRIPSQGEEPKIRRCSRCHNTAHNARTRKEIVPNNQSKMGQKPKKRNRRKRPKTNDIMIHRTNGRNIPDINGSNGQTTNGHNRMNINGSSSQTTNGHNRLNINGSRSHITNGRKGPNTDRRKSHKTNDRVAPSTNGSNSQITNGRKRQ
uniref:MULE transposase domain-containing protein n=1 Tax=Lactuca sativa TaxID=4236 RepID=A0A9R1UER3_LACSA|nr:hypothetical protein LSAT_V11C900456020 [Lactuca sativa]